jgi:multiple sugar transport system substrate-binding protein
MKRNLRIKLIAVVLFLTLFITTVSTGCSASVSGSGTSSGTTKSAVSFIAAQYSNATAPYWTEVVKNFEKANPSITVNCQVVGWDVIMTKIDTLVATNKDPDLLNMNAYSQLVQDGLLLDATKIISPSLLSNFNPSLLKGDQSNGINYALPYVDSVRSMYYNKDIFKTAGISAPPATWSELEKDCLAIKTKTGLPAFGLDMTSYEGDFFFTYFIMGNGGDWQTNGKWTLNSQANIDAITFLNKLVNVDKVVYPSPTAINRDQLMEIFEAGQLGIMETVSSFPTLIKTNSPSLNYGIAPLPCNDGQVQTSVFAQDSIMAFKSAKYPGSVGKFIDYIYQDSNYQKFITNEGFLPATLTVGNAMAAKDPSLTEFVNELKSAKTEPISDPTFAAVYPDADTACQKVLLGKSTVKNALDALQAQAEQLVAAEK